jgi:hypothetical protein
MMSLLCRPNAIPLAGAAVGLIAIFIWVTVDPRFRRIPEDPVARLNKLSFGNLSFFISLIFGLTC